MKRRQGRSWYWLYQDEQKDEGGPGTGCIRASGERRGRSWDRLHQNERRDKGGRPGTGCIRARGETRDVMGQVVSGREERETRNVVLALVVSGWGVGGGDRGGRPGTGCIRVREKTREVLPQVVSG